MNDAAGKTGATVTVGTVTAIVDAFNRHDVDAIMSYCADDVVWVMARGPEPWGRKYEGAAAVRGALVDRFASIPDARWIDGTDYVLGDSAVSEWTLVGTTTKGEKLEILGCDLWKFRDGKVIKKDTYWKQIQSDFT